MKVKLKHKILAANVYHNVFIKFLDYLSSQVWLTHSQLAGLALGLLLIAALLAYFENMKPHIKVNQIWLNFNVQPTTFVASTIKSKHTTKIPTNKCNNYKKTKKF